MKPVIANRVDMDVLNHIRDLVYRQVLFITVYNRLCVRVSAPMSEQIDTPIGRQVRGQINDECLLEGPGWRFVNQSSDQVGRGRGIV